MEENRKQIIISGIASGVLLIIIFIMFFNFGDLQLFLTKEIFDNIFSIVIGFFTAFCSTLLICISLYNYKRGEMLNNYSNQLVTIYTYAVFFIGTADEIIHLKESNQNYFVLQRYQKFLINYCDKLITLENDINLIPDKYIFKNNEKNKLLEDSKNLLGYIDNVKKSIDKSNLLFSELDIIEIQIKMQKMLTFDINNFSKKKELILKDIEYSMIELLNNSDRVKLLSFETLKKCDKLNRNNNFILRVNNINYIKVEKKKYEISISKSKIKKVIEEVMNCMKANTNEIQPINNILNQSFNSLRAIINEMSLSFDEDDTLISILNIISDKYEDILKLNSLYQSKYYNQNWKLYFLAKGINFDEKLTMDFQPEKDKIIKELNNIPEIKKINTISNEIINIINDNNLIYMIDEEKKA